MRAAAWWLGLLVVAVLAVAAAASAAAAAVAAAVAAAAASATAGAAALPPLLLQPLLSLSLPAVAAVTAASSASPAADHLFCPRQGRHARRLPQLDWHCAPLWAAKRCVGRTCLPALQVCSARERRMHVAKRWDPRLFTSLAARMMEREQRPSNAG